MLVEHTEYRSKPRAVPRMERWRVELHACKSQRVKAAERALSREQRTQEMREQFIPLVKKAGADLRMFRDLGRQTHGIDPRWAKTLNERCQKHVAELVRILDQDTDDTLPPIGDAIVVDAVNRVLNARAQAAAEMTKD